MIGTSQLMEIGRLIENLSHIQSETFIIEGGLKLFSPDGELIGFIVHEKEEWAYAPPIIASSVQTLPQTPSSPSQPIGFAERMGQPSQNQRVSRAGQSLIDPRETLFCNPPDGAALTNED